jgi:hypothetical protein
MVGVDEGFSMGNVRVWVIGLRCCDNSSGKWTLFLFVRQGAFQPLMFLSKKGKGVSR